MGLVCQELYCDAEPTSQFERGVSVSVALQNKLTVDEFPDALDGKSHLEDREKDFIILYDNSLFSSKSRKQFSVFSFIHFPLYIDLIDHQRKFRKSQFWSQIQLNLYRGAIEQILTGNITNWHVSCTELFHQAHFLSETLMTQTQQFFFFLKETSKNNILLLIFFS